MTTKFTKQFANVVLKRVNDDDIRNFNEEEFLIYQDLYFAGDYRLPADESIAYNYMVDKFNPKSVKSRNK